MEVKNIRWVGVPTRNYESMASFLQTVMGLQNNFDDPTTVEFSMSEGDEIQLMAPGDPYFDFFSEHAAGPVPLFEVEDVHLAHQELETQELRSLGQ